MNLVSVFLMAMLGSSTEPVAPTLAPSVEAKISDDLSQLSFRMVANSTVSPTRISFAAQRYRSIPIVSGQRRPDPTLVRQLYPYGFYPGGFDELSVLVGGQACKFDPATLRQPPYILECLGQGEVVIQGQLTIPRRAGPFGRSKGALTLAGLWRPRLEFEAKHSRLVLTHSSELRRVTTSTRTSMPKTDSGQKRTQATYREPAGMGTIILRSKEESKRHSLAEGFAFVTYERFSPLELKALEKTVKRSRELLRTLGLVREASPLEIIETDMRHDLARALHDVILISDRSFRLMPLEPIERFHEIEIAEMLFTHYLMRHHGHTGQSAQVLGAWLKDLYVEKHFARQEDAGEFLGILRFFPVIDMMLTAPDQSFSRAYFREVAPPDIYRDQFQNPFTFKQDGRLIYAKVLDRLGGKATKSFLQGILEGKNLDDQVKTHLSDGFYETWFGPYPKLQYRLGEISESESEARVEVIREGQVAAEPVTVLLTDDDEQTYRVRIPAGPERLRILTSTLGASLATVLLDPDGRLIETPTSIRTSPKWDNRSSPQWRAVLNYFDLQISATDGAFTSSLDLGLYRRHDPRLRLALTVGVAPESNRLSARTTYGFGRRVYSGRLEQWLGLGGFIDVLRDGFAEANTGGMGVGGKLYYGFDNRRSIWAPSPGQALRSHLSYRHDFQSGDDEVSDTIAVSLRGVQQWQLRHAHGLTLKLALDHYVRGAPPAQSLFAIGGRSRLRGFGIDEAFGRSRALFTTEWLHPVFRNLDTNLAYVFWLNRVEGGLFADVAALPSDRIFNWDDLGSRIYADFGYSLKIYFDWLGVQPSVITVDLGWPVLEESRLRTRAAPVVYIGFGHSFFLF